MSLSTSRSSLGSSSANGLASDGIASPRIPFLALAVHRHPYEVQVGLWGMIVLSLSEFGSIFFYNHEKAKRNGISY